MTIIKMLSILYRKKTVLIKDTNTLTHKKFFLQIVIISNILSPKSSKSQKLQYLGEYKLHILEPL